MSEPWSGNNLTKVGNLVLLNWIPMGNSKELYKISTSGMNRHSPSWLGRCHCCPLVIRSLHKVTPSGGRHSTKRQHSMFCEERPNSPLGRLPDMTYVTEVHAGATLPQNNVSCHKNRNTTGMLYTASRTNQTTRPSSLERYWFHMVQVL